MTVQSTWGFIPLSSFKPPSGPISVPVRRGVRRILSQIIKSSPPANAVPEYQPELRPVSQQLLNWLMPAPNWEELGPSLLSAAFADWVADGDRSGPAVVVSAPHSGVTEMARGWSTNEGWQVVNPPPRHQILTDGGIWPQELERVAQRCAEEDRRLFLPHLEQCFLRHHAGLDLVLRLLAWLESRRPPVLIACDSWAWSYLAHVSPVAAVLHNPYVLEPLDSARLAAWFQELASDGGRHAVTFRKSNNGKLVIPPYEGNRRSEEETQEPEAQGDSDFLKHLAAYSRGSPGLAWVLWRRHLRLADDEEVDDRIREKASTDDGITIWVRPQERLLDEMPDIPSAEVTSEHLLLLHTLLIHNGLPAGLLAEILPIAPGDTHSHLRYLQTLGLVNREEPDSWHVSEIGYRSVFSLMSRKDMLVSDL